MTEMVLDENGSTVQCCKFGSTQTVSVISSNQTSNAVGNGQAVVVVRLVATQDCHVAFGSSPTATTNSAFLPASSVEYVGVKGGDQVAVIRNSTDGTLYVTEMS